MSLATDPLLVQANWLGYAGTTAAPFVDYAIVDGIVAPDARAFSEKLRTVVLLFPERQRPRPSARPSVARMMLACRSELSSSVASTPIGRSPARFLRSGCGCWQQVQGSVLWLKQPGEKAKANLLAAAAIDYGIDPSRLIFAGPAALPQHLARHQLADLFLDTLPYNAHATGCDALWAGLPLLTQRGTAFAGRVCASLLTALGLPGTDY